jgi:hypothetical protein
MGYLSNYLTENPNCPLDNILNDDELLEELKKRNETLIT